jgi:hypothetical protein
MKRGIAVTQKAKAQNKNQRTNGKKAELVK